MKTLIKTLFLTLGILLLLGLNEAYCQDITTINFTNDQSYHVSGPNASEVTYVNPGNKFNFVDGGILRLYADKRNSGNVQIEVSEPSSGAYIQGIIIDGYTVNGNVSLWVEVYSGALSMRLFSHGFKAANFMRINPAPLTGGVWEAPSYTIRITAYIPNYLFMAYIEIPREKLCYNLENVRIIWGYR